MVMRLLQSAVTVAEDSLHMSSSGCRCCVVVLSPVTCGGGNMSWRRKRCKVIMGGIVRGFVELLLGKFKKEEHVNFMKNGE